MLVRDLWMSLAVAIWAICPAFANPLLLAPTGTTLATGQFRVEAAFSPNNQEGKYFWLGTGFHQCEINVIRLDKRLCKDENLIGIQWNFLPETFLTPAVSFGATDVASQSAEGIGVYLAVTRHLPIGESSRFLKNFALTVGVGAAGIRGPFVGFEAKLPGSFFAEGEYDSQDLNAAVGWAPMPYLRLKAYTIRSEFYFGAEAVSIAF